LALDVSSAEVIVSGQSNMPLNQTKAAKERIGRLQNARSKKREKESAEDFKATFGENWREESTSLLNVYHKYHQLHFLRLL
jgi:hypothetical protein